MEHTSDSKQLPLLAYRATFENLKVFYNGALLRHEIVKDRKLAADRAIRVGDYLYVEQSMTGGSEHAIKARNGVKIMWITQISTGEVLAVIEDGRLTKF